MEEDVEKEELDKEIDETFVNLEREINENTRGTEEAESSSRTSVYIINTLNLLKNDSGIVFGDRASLENVTFGGELREDTSEESSMVDRNCIVASKEKLSKWIEKHYEDFEMAFLLALAVFEKLPCMWVYEMAEELFGMMEGKK